MQRFLILSLTFVFSIYSQSSSLEKGILSFNSRADNSVELIADSHSIDEAIFQFNLSLIHI